MCTPSNHTALLGAFLRRVCLFPVRSDAVIWYAEVLRGWTRCALPSWSYCHKKGVQLHFAGLRVPPLAWMRPCHRLILAWAAGSSGASWLVLSFPRSWLVSSIYALMPIRTVVVMVGLRKCHILASKWYAVISEWDWTTHHEAASPVPWPALYHGCRSECWL